jgi:hypothetical protein
MTLELLILYLISFAVGFLVGHFVLGPRVTRPPF